MPPPLGYGALSDDVRLTSDVCLFDVCLSRTSGLSREQMTKIGTEVTHVTRDSDITFKVKRSKVNLQGAGRIVAASRTVCYYYYYYYHHHHHFLQQRGYVFVSVCLSVNRMNQKVVDRFLQNFE